MIIKSLNVFYDYGFGFIPFVNFNICFPEIDKDIDIILDLLGYQDNDN